MILIIGASIGLMVGLVTLSVFIIFELTGGSDYPRHDIALAAIVGPFPNLITGIIVSFVVARVSILFTHRSPIISTMIGLVLGILIGLILGPLTGFFVGQLAINFDMYAPLIGGYIGVFQGPITGGIVGITIARIKCFGL